MSQAISTMVYSKVPGPNEWGVDDLLQPGFEAYLGRADMLVILDPLSFAWEAYSSALQGVIVYVVLPDDLPTADLEPLFGRIFGELTVFDRVVVATVAQCDAVRPLMAMTCQVRKAGDVPFRLDWCIEDFGARVTNPTAGQPEFKGTDQLVCSRKLTPSQDKRAHIEQMAVLRPQLRKLAFDREWTVLEFGCDVDRVTAELLTCGATVIGVETDGNFLGSGTAKLKQTNGILIRNENLNEIAPKSCDLSLFVNVFHFLDSDQKRAALEIALAATRTDGHLLFIQDHVPDERAADESFFPLGVRAFQALLAETSHSGLVLEHIETVPYTHCAATRTALSLFRKVSR